MNEYNVVKTPKIAAFAKRILQNGRDFDLKKAKFKAKKGIEPSKNVIKTEWSKNFKTRDGVVDLLLFVWYKKIKTATLPKSERRKINHGR